MAVAIFQAMHFQFKEACHTVTPSKLLTSHNVITSKDVWKGEDQNTTAYMCKESCPQPLMFRKDVFMWQNKNWSDANQLLRILSVGSQGIIRDITSIVVYKYDEHNVTNWLCHSWEALERSGSYSLSHIFYWKVLYQI